MQVDHDVWITVNHRYHDIELVSSPFPLDQQEGVD